MRKSSGLFLAASMMTIISSMRADQAPMAVPRIDTPFAARQDGLGYAVKVHDQGPLQLRRSVDGFIPMASRTDG